MGFEILAGPILLSLLVIILKRNKERNIKSKKSEGLTDGEFFSKKSLEKKHDGDETNKFRKVKNLEESYARSLNAGYPIHPNSFDETLRQQPLVIQEAFIEKTGYNIEDAKIKREINELKKFMPSIEPKEFAKCFYNKPENIQLAFQKATNYNTKQEYTDYMKEYPVELQKEWAQKDWSYQKAKLVEIKQLKWEKIQELKKYYDECKNANRIGYIYVFSNRAFPKLLKIGYTFRTPEERARELSAHTALPSPFEVVYKVETIDPMEKESLIHKRLSKFRISKKRRDTEFFNIKLENVKPIIDGIAKHKDLEK